MSTQIVNYKVVTLRKKIWGDCALFIFPTTSYPGSPSVGLYLEARAERIGWFELTQSCLIDCNVFAALSGVWYEPRKGEHTSSREESLGCFCLCCCVGC